MKIVIDTNNLLLKNFREFRSMVVESDRPELTQGEINEEIRLARQETPHPKQ